MLASCSELAQNKYLACHNAALKVLFWEMLIELQLSDTVRPWYSPVVPKPNYETPEAQAYWDIPARFIGHEKKRFLAVKMSCPLTENRERNKKRRPPGMAHSAGNSSIRQYNIMIDVID